MKFKQKNTDKGRYLFEIKSGGVGKIVLNPGYYDLNMVVLNENFLSSMDVQFMYSVPYVPSKNLIHKYKIMVAQQPQMGYELEFDSKLNLQFAHVSMSCITDDVSLAYQLDGGRWNIYQGKFKIYSSTKINFYTKKVNWVQSPIQTMNVIVPTVPFDHTSSWEGWADPNPIEIVTK